MPFSQLNALTKSLSTDNLATQHYLMTESVMDLPTARLLKLVKPCFCFVAVCSFFFFWFSSLCILDNNPLSDVE